MPHGACRAALTAEQVLLCTSTEALSCATDQVYLQEGNRGGVPARAPRAGLILPMILLLTRIEQCGLMLMGPEGL